jgi:hypothetical protein
MRELSKSEWTTHQEAPDSIIVGAHEPREGMPSVAALRCQGQTSVPNAHLMHLEASLPRRQEAETTALLLQEAETTSQWQDYLVRGPRLPWRSIR